MILEKTFKYEDTEENIEFWARSKGWKPVGTPVSDLVNVNEINENTPVYQTPLKEWCENYITQVIKNELVTPIQDEVQRQVIISVEQIKEQKRTEVLNRLVIL